MHHPWRSGATAGIPPISIGGGGGRGEAGARDRPPPSTCPPPSPLAQPSIPRHQWLPTRRRPRRRHHPPAAICNPRGVGRGRRSPHAVRRLHAGFGHSRRLAIRGASSRRQPAAAPLPLFPARRWSPSPRRRPPPRSPGRMPPPHHRLPLPRRRYPRRLQASQARASTRWPPAVVPITTLTWSLVGMLSVWAARAGSIRARPALKATEAPLRKAERSVEAVATVADVGWGAACGRLPPSNSPHRASPEPPKTASCASGDRCAGRCPTGIHCRRRAVRGTDSGRRLAVCRRNIHVSPACDRRRSPTGWVAREAGICHRLPARTAPADHRSSTAASFQPVALRPPTALAAGTRRRGTGRR